MHLQYFRICRDSFDEFKGIEKEIQALDASNDEDYIVDMNRAALSTRRERTAIIGIVFAALCLEAFIFDYGATHLSKKFVTNHIDKMETPSKFIIISKLVTGKSFPTDSQAYEGLKKLVKDRNKLVHYKPKKVESENLEFQKEIYEFLKISLPNAYETVLAVSREIDNLHGNKTHYHSSFICFDQCHA